MKTLALSFHMQKKIKKSINWMLNAWAEAPGAPWRCPGRAPSERTSQISAIAPYEIPLRTVAMLLKN